MSSSNNKTCCSGSSCGGVSSSNINNPSTFLSSPSLDLNTVSNPFKTSNYGSYQPQTNQQQPGFLSRAQQTTKSSLSLCTTTAAGLEQKSLGNTSSSSSLFSPSTSFPYTATTAKWTSSQPPVVTAPTISPLRSAPSSTLMLSGSGINSQQPSTQQSSSSTAPSLVSRPFKFDDFPSAAGSGLLPSTASINDRFARLSERKATLQAQKEALEEARRRANLNNLSPFDAEPVSYDLPPKQSLGQLSLGGLASNSTTTLHDRDYLKRSVANDYTNEPFATYGNERQVTIFGFPSETSSQVTSAFCKIGPVERVEQGTGNWITITYASSWSASKALHRNGRFFSSLGQTLNAVAGAASNERITPFIVGVVPGTIEGASYANTFDANHEDRKVSFEPIVYPKEELALPAPGTNTGDSLTTKLVKYIFGWSNGK